MATVFSPPICNLKLSGFNSRCYIPWRPKPAPIAPDIHLSNHNCSCKYGKRFPFRKSALLKFSTNFAQPVYEMYDEYTTDLEDTESEKEGRNKSNNFDFSFLNLSDSEDESPWEGAIVYKRDPTVNHLEYCTTLERLGMEDLSNHVSKTRSSIIGLRVTREVKDYPFGTPVQVSVDVSKRKENLRLDGIMKTVICLLCHRCGDPAAKCIFTNFAFLLVPEYVEEPVEDRHIRVRGQGENKTYIINGVERNEGEDDSVDWDDRLYFPQDADEVDLSKNIRDMIHVEIAMDTLCHPHCKGICDKCFGNLNTNSCECEPIALPA